MYREILVHQELTRLMPRQIGVPTVVKLYEVLENSKYIVMVLELCGMGTFENYLRTKEGKRLDEVEARSLF